jgi:hypothetical protein
VALKLPFKRILSFNDSTRNWEKLKSYVDGLDVTDASFDSRLDTLEAIESVTAPTFATGWSNFGAPYSNAGYYKDRQRVYLRGGVKNNGTGAGLIFTLPVGYRPPATNNYVVSIFGGNGLVTVASDGTVTDGTFTSPGSKTITNLGHINFRIA